MTGVVSEVGKNCARVGSDAVLRCPRTGQHSAASDGADGRPISRTQRDFGLRTTCHHTPDEVVEICSHEVASSILAPGSTKSGQRPFLNSNRNKNWVQSPRGVRERLTRSY